MLPRSTLSCATDLKELVDTLQEANGPQRDYKEAISDLAFREAVLNSLEDGTATTTAGAGSSGGSGTHAQLQVPEGFVCPLSQLVFRDPCILVEAGSMYERDAIEEWLSRNGTDPLTSKRSLRVGAIQGTVCAHRVHQILMHVRVLGNEQGSACRARI